MLGWFLSVYRQADSGSEPASDIKQKGVRLGVWQAKWWGLDWLETLVTEGNAMQFSFGGYPNLFTAQAKFILPVLRSSEGPPGVNKVWNLGESDVVIASLWIGETRMDFEAIGVCRAEEWLLIEAWDES